MITRSLLQVVYRRQKTPILSHTLVISKNITNTYISMNQYVFSENTIIYYLLFFRKSKLVNAFFWNITLEILVCDDIRYTLSTVACCTSCHFFESSPTRRYPWRHSRKENKTDCLGIRLHTERNLPDDRRPGT